MEGKWARREAWTAGNSWGLKGGQHGQRRRWRRRKKKRRRRSKEKTGRNKTWEGAAGRKNEQDTRT